MILYPAIDLKGGACVRLVRGDMNAATVFNTDPAAQARAWAAAGFSWLHVVDLDGSLEGAAVNAAAVQAILAAATLPLQLGGGVRTLADVAAWLKAGVSRVILGTMAVREPALVREAARRWPGQVAVGVDVRAGRVAISGWTEDTDLRAVDLARRFEEAGVAALVVTDIDRDGAMTGFDIEIFGAVADAVGIPVIAAGGLAGVDDILKLRRRAGTPVAGAVLGRALYSGAIEAGAALAAARC
jgi:phosphoribosylformimino-5-aminoimidazole carboxamide ribotide isomerase